MRFTFVAASVALLASLLPSAFGFFDILAPADPNYYWVQNTSNTIYWIYYTDAPSSVSILIRNANDDSLNGAFSIAEFVNTSDKSYTITYVTLKTGDGYVVEFVNPNNQSDGYTLGQPFTVQPPGTPPANLTDVLQIVATNNGTENATTLSSSTSSSGPTSTVQGPAAPTVPTSAALREVALRNWKTLGGIVGLVGMGAGLLL